MNTTESFNLHTTLIQINQAVFAVVCHIFFEAGLHGLISALIIGIIGSILLMRKQRFGKPFIAVGKKLGLVCSGLMLPGILAILKLGHLPAAGVFNVNSLGFMVFWSLVSLYLCAEEMNYQWF